MFLTHRIHRRTCRVAVQYSLDQRGPRRILFVSRPTPPILPYSNKVIDLRDHVGRWNSDTERLPSEDRLKKNDLLCSIVTALRPDLNTSIRCSSELPIWCSIVFFLLCTLYFADHAGSQVLRVPSQKFRIPWLF